MAIEQDPYSFIKYINLMNMYNDSYGDPTIHVFVEMGLLTVNEKLICTINDTEYECYIGKNTNNLYVLCYQNKIQHINVTKFIIYLSKLIKIKIRKMGVSFARIRRVTDNRTLCRLCYELKTKFEHRLTDILMDSEFGIWEIHTSFDFENKKIKFICKSNTKYDDILQIIDNNKNIHNNIHDRIYKEKQQLYSLLKHDAIEIIYQPKTDDDIIKYDSGSHDISYGSGIYNDIHLMGSIAIFVKNSNNNHHYALTANHVINELDTNLVNMQRNITSIKHLSIDSDNIIELNYDAVLFRIKGIPYCKITNLDCTALSDEDYDEVLISSSSSSNESNSQESDKTLDKQSLDPTRVTVSSLKSLCNRHTPNRISIFKYGAATNLTMGFIKKVDTKATVDNTRYTGLIEVEWIDGTEFTSGGDSGSLYFLYDLTINAFVPIAMHVGSKKKKSYGIIISYIFEELFNRNYEFLICNSTDCQEN